MLSRSSDIPPVLIFFLFVNTHTASTFRKERKIVQLLKKKNKCGHGCIKCVMVKKDHYHYFRPRCNCINTIVLVTFIGYSY